MAKQKSSEQDFLANYWVEIGLYEAIQFENFSKGRNCTLQNGIALPACAVIGNDIRITAALQYPPPEKGRVLNGDESLNYRFDEKSKSWQF